MNEEKGGQMKELDLDELHAAVSKLMNDTQKEKPKRELAKAPERDTSTKPVNQSDQPENPTQQPSSEQATTVPVRRTTLNVAPRKRGVAMDVVQPAKPAGIAPPSARAGRMAPSLQPTKKIAPEPPAPRETTVPQPVAQPETPKSNDVDDDVLASIDMHTDKPAAPALELDKPEVPAAAFPDPLDVHGFTLDEEAQKEKEEPAKPAATPFPTPQESEPAKEESPDAAPSIAATPPAESGTPFVNAKVEKRPLGAYAEPAPSVTTQTEVQQEEAPPQEKPEIEPKADPITAALPPKELSPEIVAVESAEPEVAGGKGDSPANALRHMAIPPQYHVPNKQPVKEERPIFDTKEYHPPIHDSSAHKKRSRVGLIILLVLLLAGVGAVTYLVLAGGLNVTRLL